MGSRAAPVAKRAWWLHHYTFFRTAVGLIFVWLSLTPSLLPRGPLFQGLISGSAGAIGYGLGVFGVWLVRYLRSMERSPAAPRWAWLTLLGVGMVGQLLMITWFHFWQNDVRAKVGVANLGFWAHPQAAVLSIVFLFLIVEIGQLIGKLASYLVRQVDRIAPPRVSAVVVVALLLTFTIALLNGVVGRVAMNVVNNSFESVNDETDPASPAPTTSLRSGGPGSLVSWKSLGNQGRIFMTNGPTVDELSKFNGAKAAEPIRVYAGMNSADDIKGAAALAADELVRTRGLERKVVAVVTTTGTGWINEAEASALEYMLNGDTAIVSMQYSFLPSGLSFLVDSEHARQAGQALFEAVDADLKKIPEAKRPRLLVFGESLGSFGGEAPFLAVNNLVARTDGALFSGPPFMNTIWNDLTNNRAKGSPQWLPVFDDGEHVRFVSQQGDLDRPASPWGSPRVVYLQHASDPITWWNPDLLLNEPDWLREPPGRDVSAQMFWIPVVTFMQVAADMAVSVDVPDGHGHVFLSDVANAWAAILQPLKVLDGWSDAKTEKLRPILRADHVK
jgi:uncharacterized membrane protein